MVTPEEAQFLTEAVAALAAPLHDGLDKGRLIAHEHYDKHDMTGTGYTKGRTDLTRDHARRYLERLKPLHLSGWTLNQRRSGRIHLTNETLTLRVLHGTPLDTAPAPGKNQARISYYRNPQATLLGVQASNLLAVWTNHPSTGELSIRIVRPIEAWKHGHAPIVDLDFVLPRSSEDFGKWEFVSDDRGLNLPFIFDEDEREEGESSGA
jgi:hypothetical protein